MLLPLQTTVGLPLCSSIEVLLRFCPLERVTHEVFSVMPVNIGSSKLSGMVLVSGSGPGSGSGGTGSVDNGLTVSRRTSPEAVAVTE